MATDNGSGDIKITIVYDNNPYRKGLKTDWGFGCVITGLEKTILFDTGGNGEILLSNMQALHIDPKSIDVVVLSHIHGDHTDGLWAFLAKNPKVSVYLPASFPSRFKKKVSSLSANVVEVHEATEVFDGVFTTGQVGDFMLEQALVITTPGVTAVISGCAHPGIEKMVAVAQKITKRKRFLVTGGFHLGGASKETIQRLIASLKELGVEWAGPCHCSGDLARNLFKEAFGDHYVDVGVGKIIELSALK